MLKLGRYWPWKTVWSHFHMPVQPILLHRPSFLFDCFVKIWATCKNFSGKWFTPLPPGQKIARTPIRLIYFYIKSRVKYLHGSRWKSMEFRVSIEFHGMPWSIHGVPWNAMEFHEVSMEFHGMPLSSTEFHEVLMEFHGKPWNSMEFPWRSMEFYGIL